MGTGMRLVVMPGATVKPSEQFSTPVSDKMFPAKEAQDNSHQHPQEHIARSNADRQRRSEQKTQGQNDGLLDIISPHGSPPDDHSIESTYERTFTAILAG
jgi:hypothetical protein